MKIEMVCEKGCKPVRKHPADAGADLKANAPNGRRRVWVIPPMGECMIPTGVRVCIPLGYVGLLAARSSLHKKGLILSNGIGVIDSGYTGEIKVPLKNLSAGNANVECGERIAQLIVLPCVLPAFVKVSDLAETERGEGGFGSTGAM